MENASKALTIAGGIFIALMILGALILMFSNLSSYREQKDATQKDTQLVDFNNQFTPYDKSDLTLMELKSLYNKVQNHNSRNSSEEIVTNIETVYPGIKNDFKNMPEEDKQTAVFECTKVEYTNGKISKMEFKKVVK